MNNIELMSKIKESVNRDEVRSYDGNGREISYVPVFTLDGLDFGFGIEGWFVGDDKKSFPINGVFHAAPALPILKKPISEVRSALEENNLSEWFPFHLIAKIGINQKSQFWAELALNWIINLDHKDQIYLIPDLESVTRSRWSDQKFRQLVAKEIKRLKALGG